MKELSYTQEFYLCVVNEKGNIPVMRSDYINACIIVAGLMELLEHGYVEYDENGKNKDKVVVAKEWDNALPHLLPLYRTIESYKKPKDIKGIAEGYVFGGFIQNKPRNELVEAIAVSLVEAGSADAVVGKRKTKYIPKKEAVTRIVEKIRAELLDEGTVTADTLCLTALLDKSSMLKRFFSKFEIPQLKSRIKEVRENESFASLKETIDHIDSIITLIIIIIAAAAR